MAYNPMSKEFQDESKEEEKWDDLFHTLKLDNCSILRRAKEAENAYIDGDVKIGSFEDFWKDMND